MSATRNPKRTGLDFYTTPPQAVDDIVDFLPTNENLIVLDAGCGRGNIANRLTELGYLNVYGCDLVERWKFNADFQSNYSRFEQADFLDPLYNPTIDWIIMNPPFNSAIQFISKAISMVDIVFALVRSGFTHGVKRTKWLEVQPLSFELKLRRRYSFTNGGVDNSEYSWLLFDRTMSKSHPEIAWVPTTKSEVLF